MTKEQETIAKLEEYISIYEQLKCNIQPSEVNAIETVLSMLKEKDAEIQLQKDINKTEQNRHKQTEKSLKGQLKKKDEIIDEMAEWINRIDSTIFCNKTECNDNCKECVIKEFTKKVEE